VGSGLLFVNIFKVVMSKAVKKNLKKLPKNVLQKLISWIDLGLI
jgi:mRNA-degrading endonuclease RelE of RelBE toxin-antitoxin system